MRMGQTVLRAALGCALSVWSCAAAVYREAAALAPQDASRADKLADAGDAVNAILEYRRAFELDPENEAALDAFSRETARIGGAGAAIERARKRLKGASGDVATRLLLAEMLRSEGRLNEAREQFALARRSAPGSVMALRGIVRVCLLAADFDCAAEVIPLLAVRSKTFDQARAPRARFLLAEGRTEAALNALGANPAGAAVEARDAETLDVLADCYRARGEVEKERAALEKLSQLTGERDPDVLGRLARARAEAGESEAALSALAELLRADPGSAVGRLGRSLLVAPDAPEPAATLNAKLEKQSAEDDTPSPEKKSQRGEVARPSANLAARRAARVRDEGEAALFWGQSARAVAPLREALSVWPSSPRLHLALGRALLQTGDAEGAIGELTALTTEGGAARADALLLVAQARESLRDPQHALLIYEYILARHPSDLSALQGQARAYGQMNRMGRAAAVLSTLARLAPEESSIREHLQSALDSLGRVARTPLRTSDIRPAARVETAGLQDARGDSSSRASLEPLLGTGDTVRVKILGRVFAAPLKLDDDGRLWLDARTPFEARCRTAQELREVIARSLSPAAAGALEVEVVELQSAPLTVAGAVNSPGDFHVKRSLNLQQSLMLASGAAESSGDVLFVLRGVSPCSDEPTRTGRYGASTFGVTAYNLGEADEGLTTPAQPLGPGVVVYVPEHDTAFVAGEVARPAVINVQQGLTLTDAIRIAGGTTGGVRRDRVRLLRLLPGGVSYQEFILDLGEIERKQVGDVILRANDIVEIESAGSRAPSMSAFARLLQGLASPRGAIPADGSR